MGGLDVVSPFISVHCHSDWLLTLPLGVSSTYWRCPSRPCVVFLACVSLALFLALSLSPGNSVVSSWCDQYASFLALTVSNSSLFTPALLRTHSFVSLLSTKPAESFSALSSQRRRDVFLHSLWVSNFHSCTVLQATLTLSLVVTWGMSLQC